MTAEAGNRKRHTYTKTYDPPTPHVIARNWTIRGDVPPNPTPIEQLASGDPRDDRLENEIQAQSLASVAPTASNSRTTRLHRWALVLLIVTVIVAVVQVVALGMMLR